MGDVLLRRTGTRLPFDVQRGLLHFAAPGPARTAKNKAMR